MKRGLGTDQAFAEQVCTEITDLSNDKRYWNLNPKNPQDAVILAAFQKRSLEIFYDCELDDQDPAPDNLDYIDALNDVFKGSESLSELQALATTTLSAEELKQFDPSPESISAQDNRRVSASTILSTLRTALEDRKELQSRLKFIEPAYSRQNEEIEEYRREKNKHVKVTVGEAVEAFKSDRAKKKRSDMTRQQINASLESFVASLLQKEKSLLGQIRSSEIDAWLNGLVRVREKRENKGAPLSFNSKRDKFADLRVFFNWAKRKYEMYENPIENVIALDDQEREQKTIVAIRRFEDLKSFIQAWEKIPYFQAWVAVGCLAGLRYSEQAHLRMKDVFLEDGYLRVAKREDGHTSKTGKERNVAIEQTIPSPNPERSL